jgi:hypothetical protein
MSDGSRQELGIVAAGKELELALHGTPAQIHAYLDQVRRDHGRTAELCSADRISAEQNGRRLARLTEEGRILNPSCPGGVGTADEHVGLLRVMAHDIASICLPDEGATLCTHSRWLAEFDVDLSPPAVKLISVPAVREVFTRLLDTMYPRDRWDFYIRSADLDYFGHPGVDIPVPNVDPIRLTAVSDEAIRMALASRRWPGVPTSADLLASLREDTQEPAQAALESSLADRLRALDRGGDFLVTMADLAAELSQRFGVTVSPQALQMRVKKGADELVLAGIRVEATNDREPKSRRALYRVRIEIHPSHPSHPSLELPPAETREG